MKFSILRRWMREPLVHFILLGALLFLAYGWWGDEDAGSSDIVVSARTIGGLAQGFTRTWQRPPTQQELDALVEQHIKDEIYYREALAAGLDRDDTIVRQRLRQKMEFLQEDVAAQIEPSDEDLRAYLERNAGRYETPARATFAHVYLSADRRAAHTGADAERLLVQLRASSPSSTPAGAGDPFPLALEFENIEVNQLDRLFGEGFSAQLAKRPRAEWSGPVKSGYGLHLVRVMSFSPAAPPAFADIRDALARDWSAERRERIAADFYRELRKRYDVTVEAAADVTVLQAAKDSP
jgi:hypothetical protein